MPPVVKRSRSWVFTTNNYDNENLPQLQQATYLCYGKEVGANGTPHLQGFIHFPAVKSLSQVRTILPNSHLEIRRGTILQAVEYCKKDGDFVEFGTRPMDPGDKGDAERKRWKDAWDLAKAGMFKLIEGDIENIDPRILLPFYAGIKRIQRDYAPIVADLPAGVKYAIWIYGPAGSGKTKSVADQYPEAYRKPLSKWWDSYQGQEVAVLDDVDPTHSSWIGRFLKIWGDRYSFGAEVKGGSMSIRPRRFIVTSQYTIEEVFADAQTREALLRRYIVIAKTPNQNIII